ncbi:unnamed protein product, partial [Brachionus calyciflorus]
MQQVYDSDEFKLFLKLSEKGLVFPSRTCQNNSCRKYNQDMGPFLKKRSKEAKNFSLFWRCSSCSRTKTVYDDSFFLLFRKSPKTILALFKCWAAQLTIVKTISIIELNYDEKIRPDSVMSVFYKLRQICSLSLEKEKLKLGGFGRIVEIDESMYAKVKHWVGKDLGKETIWVFGLVERRPVDASEEDDSKCYMEIVEDREAATLLNIISCTNRIESLWSSCKAKFKEMRGCNRGMIQSYIDEYVWRFNNKCTTDSKKAYDMILNGIKIYYKPGTQCSDFESNFKNDKSEDIYEIESDCSSDASETSSEQDYGSVLGSLGESGEGDFRNKDFESEDENECGNIENECGDNDISEETVKTTNENSDCTSTLTKNESESNKSVEDIDDLENDSFETVNQNPVENIEIKVQNIKLKANLYENLAKSIKNNEESRDLIEKK